jgi:hypothetical protein
MMAFRKQFDSGFPSIFRENFGDPIWNDGLFYRDFATHSLTGTTLGFLRYTKN